MSDPMPMIVPPLFWEWFNIWLTQFLKDLYHEIKMVGLRGGNNTNSPYSHTCANHGIPSQLTGIDMTLNIPTSLTMSSPAGAPHLNPNQVNVQSLSTVSLQFVHSAPPVNPGSHNHHSHSRNHSHSHNLNHILGHNSSVNHTHSLGLGRGHSHTNSGLGANHSHSNCLGPNANHSNKSTLALGGSHSHGTNIGLSGSHNSNVCLGGSHCHTTNLGLGGHSHSSNLGLSGSHSHGNNLGQGGSHGHSSNLGLGSSHNHSSNLGLAGSHCHTTNLGPSGSHSHSSNLGLSGSHNHGANSGLGGSHSHTLLGGSHSSSLGGHSLVSGLNPNNNHSLSSTSLIASHNLSNGQNLSIGPNLSINLNLTSSQNLGTVQNLNSSRLNKTTSHNQTQKVEASRYSAPNCVLHSQAQQYRLLKQACRPVECYHPNGAAAATYMQSSNGGSQSASQASLRVQPTPPQPSAPPAPQQDLSKTTLTGHNFVSQTQTQPRPQYASYQQYRATQHGSRPNSHPRQQQSFIPGAAPSTGPVMYPTLLFQPTHMGMPTYQQPRSGSPGYYQYHMGHYIGYNNPPSHTPPYYGYAANSPQLPTPNLQSNSSGGRNNPTTLGPQGSPATPAAPAVSLSLPQPPTHLQQSMPGIRPAPVQKRSHRLPIIDPVTQQDIFSDLYPTTNEYFLSGEQNDGQTPQPEPPTHSIAEEFTRMVNEAVNQPSLENAVKTNFVPKNVELPVSSMITAQPQNAISSLSSINNNNVLKSDLVNINDNRSLGPDGIATTCETPVVSAISDSPVIVPKMTLNVKPIQKIETTVQSIVLDTNKNTQINKQNALPTEKVDTDKEIVRASVVIGAAAAVTLAPAVVALAPVAAAPAAAPVSTVTTSTTVVAEAAATAHTTLPSLPLTTAAPQPQRASRDRHHKSEEKDKLNKIEKEIVVATCKQNGPTTTLSISSVDSFQQAINLPTSQSILNQSAGKKQTIITKPIIPTELATPAPEQTLTATELLSAGIEKVAREQLLVQEPVPERKLSAFEAQAKLTQSISSVCRAQQSESKMKDINLNSKTTDPDTANGNATEVTKTDSEDVNKNEKSVKNTKNNSKKVANMANNDAIVKDTESCENGNDETDKVVDVEQEVITAPAQEEPEIPVLEEKVDEAPAPPSPTVFVPKYKYTDEQWSPLNKSGKKCYDIGLLKQIKEDPLSKNKPNAPLLEACNVIRTAPMQDPMPFTPISRPLNDSLLPTFVKAGLGSPRNVTPRDPKKDGRNMAVTGKGSAKLGLSPSSNSAHKPVIHVSLSLREDVKLKQVDSAWKPTRFMKENLAEDELKTQELYKKFRGILNKLTPQKFETLLDKVKTLEINNQKRMEGVIDLLFEKAIEEPNFSEAYAAMCNKLSVLKVPSENNPEQPVNFRALIISKCQNQFEAGKSDEQVMKMEKELAESNDPAKKKELQLLINEENRKIRLRAVANVRFIGELYKLKMLTCKIMDYCMRHLIEKLEEEKLECLCKLLTTIGEQVENEGVSHLDGIFKKMQDIVERKSNKISSRVKFMLQDVIDLRRKRWVIKSVVDSQPKMMDQIQKEAEQQQRHIELMNASGMGSGGGGGGGGGHFRRDDGGRGKRGGDNRRQNQFMDNTFARPARTTVFPVDTSKLPKSVEAEIKSTIRLAPPHSQWNHTRAAGAKPQQAPATSSISNTNKYSVLENVQADPTSFRANRDSTPTYSKGASIERSTFTSRGDFTTGGNRSGSMGVTRSNYGAPAVAAESSAPAPTSVHAPTPPSAPQEPLPDDKMRNSVKSTINLSLLNPDDEELVAEVKQLFAPQYHAAVIGEILNVVLEKNAKEVIVITKSLLHLVATNTITPENFVAGLKETFDIAPDLFIDIPLLYDYLGKILAPHIEKKHITIAMTFDLSENIISANHGHLLLKAIINCMNESMGPTFVKSKWQESGLKLSQWMSEEQVPKWIVDNKFEFLEGGSQACEESAKILTPTETQSRLLELMNANETCDCIVGWVKDKLGKASNEDWFMRALIQAICEHALYGNAYFNQDRMSKYDGLIHKFGDSKESREVNCLFGIQHLIHRLEHPQGLTLEIFQYLNEKCLISLDVFLAWEASEKEPEGKGVMLKALTSFFTNINEAENEDSGSED